MTVFVDMDQIWIYWWECDVCGQKSQDDDVYRSNVEQEAREHERNCPGKAE